MDKHYQTQSKNWIKELPVKNISKNDCALFMWTTDAHIKEAIETIESWGFKYKTIAFVWEKKTKTGKTVANLGAWTMKNYEICLLGTKGAMLKHKKVNNIYQKVEEVRTKHSKNLGDKEWAKKVYKKAANRAKDPSDLNRLTNSMYKNLGSSLKGLQ